MLAHAAHHGRFALPKKGEEVADEKWICVDLVFEKLNCFSARLCHAIPVFNECDFCVEFDVCQAAIEKHGHSVLAAFIEMFARQLASFVKMNCLVRSTIHSANLFQIVFRGIQKRLVETTLSCQKFLKHRADSWCRGFDCDRREYLMILILSRYPYVYLQKNIARLEKPIVMEVGKVPTPQPLDKLEE